MGDGRSTHLATPSVWEDGRRIHINICVSRPDAKGWYFESQSSQDNDIANVILGLVLGISRLGQGRGLVNIRIMSRGVL